MKKLIIAILLGISMLGFSAQDYPSAQKDSRGVLIMEENDWIKFFNNSGVENEVCPIIGALIMEESYIKEGKKMGTTLAENQEIRKELSNNLLELGIDQIASRKDRLDEFYYAAVCKKLTDKEFDLVGSKIFKNKMNNIFIENKIEK